VDFSSLNVASWSREPWRGDPLVWMARDGWPRPTINLLQGSRAVHGSWKKYWKTFRVTVWILVFWIVLRGGMSFFEINSLQKQARLLDQRIEQVFRTAFPEVGKIVHAPSQMTQRLQSLRKNAQLNAGAGFLELFTKAGMILKSHKYVTLTRVHFHDGVLDLFLKTGDLQQLDGIVQDLKMKAELTATIRKANRGDDGVDGHIRIGEK
ncbi:MAG: type II secretion system protein GspL, partial [Magnetococcus sp. XQGC-1]